MVNKFDILLDQNDSQSHGNITNSTKHVTPPGIGDGTYTEEELSDVNAITVSIPDQNTPIVVFFGSPASGKTLALLRMIRFLESHDHHIIPEENFRPKSDLNYKRICSKLKDLAYNGHPPVGFRLFGFMLIKVLNRVGQPVCQILKIPSEHYFDVFPNENLPTYINAITTSPNRKVWVLFVEQGWGEDQNERDRYAQKICSMQSLISPNDKIVFLFNKADRQRVSGQYDKKGKPIKNLFFNHIKREYPGIFTKYQNTGWLTKLLYGEYNFKAVCFSSGIFNKNSDGSEIWTYESDWYCAELWNAIK